MEGLLETGDELAAKKWHNGGPSGWEERTGSGI